jgi:NAD(P)-dependent dehydrogenase (short-subunit alcohol dehydrogenase family)
MRLEKKVIIVTGAANGIGEEMCRTFAGEGANVVLADVAIDKANAIAADITKTTGSKAVAVKCDVSQTKSRYRTSWTSA